MPTLIPVFHADLVAYTLFASASIKQGEIAVLDGGKVKAATDTLIQAGATVLGVAQDDYIETTGADVTRRMVFMRFCEAYIPSGKAADAPTAANVGGLVYINNKSTIKITPAAGDFAVTLLEAITGGGYRVWI